MPTTPTLCTVTVRYTADTYIARAGSGKAAKTASCTCSAEDAVRSAATKYLLSGYPARSASELELTRELRQSHQPPTLNFAPEVWTAALPVYQPEGGAQ